MRGTLLFLVLAVAAAPSAVANTITGLCNTGMTTATSCGTSDSLANESNGTADPNYVASGMTGAVSGTYYDAPYYADNPSHGPINGADWIGTYANGVHLTAIGLYNYTETITASSTSAFTITGSWAVDNCGQIFVNGVAAGGSGTTIGGGITSGTCNASASNFQNLQTFSINLSGSLTYTLDYEVYNSTVSPTGLLVTDLSVSPEPSSAMLALAGFGLLGIGIRNRWNANRARSQS
jgi:PEP-CTERM motif